MHATLIGNHEPHLFALQCRAEGGKPNSRKGFCVHICRPRVQILASASATCSRYLSRLRTCWALSDRVLALVYFVLDSVPASSLQRPDITT